MSDITDHDKLVEIEKFYKDAFCGKSARVLDSIDGFDVGGVVEIDTGDKRGIMFVGILTQKESK